MSQQGFQDRHSTFWRETWELIESVDRDRPDPATASFPERYRRICQHLALARHRMYGAELVDGLNRAALRGHNLLYKRVAQPFARLSTFVASDFPRAVRRDAWLLALATLLFFGPLVATSLTVYLRPDLIYTVVDPGTVAEVEAMYDPSGDHFLRERASDSDLLMFGFYIRNNIGIGFRTFASGLLLGLGSALLLVVNGLFIGAVAGHLVRVGYGSTFFSFVIGHGAFELTAIVLAGLAGMKLGGAILAPGRLSRARALVEAARQSIGVVYGLAGMLVIAAFLEAFWSSTTAVPATVKLVVGAVLWLFVLTYFLAAGRGRRGAR
jgi:uncharacterized membrane protein SpoIIM required for sporulation